MKADLLIVGAGVAGLACAREAVDMGAEVLVLERSRGVGGRCATRRIDGQALDHGVVFLHGSDETFLAAVEAVETSERIDGWPSRVTGGGTPCQPRAFRYGERRFAFADGVNAFPKHLALGLPIRRMTEIGSIMPSGSSWHVTATSGDRFTAPNLALALPAAQTLGFLDQLDELSDELRATKKLLGMLGSYPCLTVLATYPLDSPAPDWDINYPADSDSIQLVAHDSSKRTEPDYLGLVIQALPRWSRAHIGEPPEAWGRLLLSEAAEHLGGWALEPTSFQSHRWRFSRTDRGMELATPIRLTFPGGLGLGLAGEVFSRGAGVEAAWLSGHRLARRILKEDSA